jgi:amidophosphoribosyltransferase
VIIEKGKAPQYRQVAPQRNYAPDLFEYVYFARPDSFLDGISVYRARLDMGRFLAETVARALAPRKVKDVIDVVIPVPDTSRESALELAMALQLKYREGFVKNRYVGRTFIMPGQQDRYLTLHFPFISDVAISTWMLILDRQKNVRRKLNAMELEFRGKSVLIVDDSIVRGTTSREIVQMAREKGARKVYFASCAPAIRYPHIHGIDLADTKELVANGRSAAEVAEEIGADAVIYQELEDLKDCVRGFNPAVLDFEDGVFTGQYVTGCPPHYLEHLEKVRGVNARSKELEKRKTLETIKLNGIEGGMAVETPEEEDGGVQHKAAEDISLINMARQAGSRV